MLALMLAGLPWMLLVLRLLLGPVMLFASLRGVGGAWLAAALAVGILSDIFDGIIARRLRVATQRLRRLDSLVDTLFVLCALASAWLLCQDELMKHIGLLTTMLALNLISYIPALIRFRRAPAYHAYSAKASGLVLFVAAAWLFLTGQAGWLLDAAIILTIISHLDRIAITFMLPEWRTDVAGIWVLLAERAGARL